jgi:hypothetical protein
MTWCANNSPERWADFVADIQWVLNAREAERAAGAA